MRNEKLEAVRQACIGANPGILDLVFGCMVQISEDGAYDIFVRFSGTDGHILKTTGLWITKGSQYKIIGRKIGAIDLLKALESVPGRWMIQSSPYDDRVEFVDMNDYNKKGFKNSYFVFVGDDLSLQSPETISFLHGLLRG